MKQIYEKPALEENRSCPLPEIYTHTYSGEIDPAYTGGRPRGKKIEPGVYIEDDKIVHYTSPPPPEYFDRDRELPRYYPKEEKKEESSESSW